jgi:SAM-dependent methyltransferase
LLRIAKSRLTRLNGQVPDNLIFLHADALQMPFAPNTFNTIIALNLLDVLDDFHILLNGLKNIVTADGTMLFTILILGNRLADNYLKVWENAGEVVTRPIEQLETVFIESGMPIDYEINGDMAFISC